MSQKRRTTSNRKRHASTRLKKLEAELANLKAMPGSKMYLALEQRVEEARKEAGVNNDLKIKGFPTTNYRTGEDPTPGASSLTIDPITGRQVILPSFANKYTPKDLKKELGRTPEPKPKDPTYGTGMPSNYPGGHRGGGKVTDDFTNKTTSTTKTKSTPKPTTTEPSSSRELRIKNFKPSAIQKKLIAGGWSANELVDLQIKHEDWRKKTGRA